MQITLHRLTLAFLMTVSMFLAACGGGGDSATPAPVGPSALQIIDNVVGTGATAKLGDQITVHYTLWFYSATATDFKGTLLQSSEGGPVFKTLLGSGLIEAWIQGIPGMKVGGTRTLLVPSALAYGSQGTQGIPPNTPLVFTVRLISIP